MKPTLRALLVALLALGGPAAAQDGPLVPPRGAAPWALVIRDGPELSDASGDDCAVRIHDPVTVGGPMATGRAIAQLSSSACLAQLEAAGVPHERVLDSVGGREADGPGVDGGGDGAGIDGVVTPVRLTGPIQGVEVRGAERAVIDCRLVAALAAWAPELRGAGIRRLRAASIHRPGARVRRSGRVSGHAHALALDLGGVVLEDGSEVSILHGWEAREPGADPCGAYDEAPDSARIRAAVCTAVRADLFQVVLTPHHDRSHQNHLHLEVVPGVGWSYVH